MVSQTWSSIAIALFTFEIIACFVLLACLLLTVRFKWTRNGRKDSLRTLAFVVATVAAIIFFLISLVSIGLTQTVYLPPYYNIFYIFLRLFNRIAEFAILAVVVRTVHRSFFNDVSSASSPKCFLRGLTVFVLSLAGLASLVSFALITTIGAFQIIGRYSYRKISLAALISEITYTALYLLCTMLLFVMAILALVRMRSKASSVVLLVVICLNIRTILLLVSTTVGATLRAADNLFTAAQFVYIFATMATYLGVALVAVMQPNRLPPPKHGVTPEAAYSSEVAIPSAYNGPIVYT